MLTHLAKPWITATALLGLIVSLLALDISQLSTSTVGQWIHRHGPFATARINVERSAILNIVVTSDGQARALTSATDSGDLNTTQMYVAGWVFKPTRSGVFGLTREKHDFHVHVRPAINGTPEIPEHMPMVRAAFIHAMRTSNSFDSATISELASGDHDRSRILWLGWAHNTLALLSLIILPLSLGWVPNAWKHWRSARRPRGVCPACGYDQSGLPSNVCPECGNRMEPLASNAECTDKPR